jgi:hypothetical protein
MDLVTRVVPGSNNFQFEKRIPGSTEVMRIEFMAPEEFKRPTDFRVDVDPGVHARSCTGGSIAIAESSLYPLSGKLPDGSAFQASVRVTKPHALVMLKLWLSTTVIATFAARPKRCTIAIACRRYNCRRLGESRWV